MIVGLGLLLALVASAIGSDDPVKAPPTPEALAQEVVRALAAGDLNGLRPVLPTRQDLAEADTKAGEHRTPETLDAELAGLDTWLPTGFASLQQGAASAGVSWSQVSIASTSVAHWRTGALTRYRVDVVLRDRDAEHAMMLEEVELLRGVVLMRKPRVTFGGVCTRGIDHLIFLSQQGSTAEAKNVSLGLAGQRKNLVEDCRAKLESKPERTREKLACQRAAVELRAAMSCR